MRRMLRWLALGLGGLVGIALIVMVTAYVATERGRTRPYPLADVALPVTGTPEQVEHGRHLAVTRGCTDCHGADLSGALVVDAGPVGRFVATNLTRGGRGQRYDAAKFEHAIRHGVSAQGRSLLFMP